MKKRALEDVESEMKAVTEDCINLHEAIDSVASSSERELWIQWLDAAEKRYKRLVKESLKFKTTKEIKE